MPITIRALIEGRDRPVTTSGNASVQEALELMLRHDFTQLPVTDAHGTVLGLTTSDSIVRVLGAFGAEPEQRMRNWSSSDNDWRLTPGANATASGLRSVLPLPYGGVTCLRSNLFSPKVQTFPGLSKVEVPWLRLADEHGRTVVAQFLKDRGIN
jgi:CBS-domain-containing membrane protein